MSEDNYGTCVVLTPSTNYGLPDHVKGGLHITLLYFGDGGTVTGSDELALLDVVSRVAESYSGSSKLKTDAIERFGPEKDAVVVTMEAGPESEATQIRNEILANLPRNLLDVFEEAETYPDYKPHMTLGYIGEVGEEALSITIDDVPEYIFFDTIQVWSGSEQIGFKLPETEEEIEHYGIIRKSGRYPWGSGSNPHQRSRDFVGMVDDLKSKGLSESDIAKGLGLNTRELRENKKIAKAQLQKAIEAQVVKLKDKGMSNMAIGRQMNMNESSVRSYLNPTMKARRSQLENTADRLRQQLEKGTYLDVSEGSELYLGVSRGTLKAAARLLEEEGYKIHYLNIRQVGTGKDTKTLILAPDIPYKDFLQNRDKIEIPDFHSTDGGETFVGFRTPTSVDSKRLSVRYGPDGGNERDGIIEIRPGVEGLSLGNKRYAQVRIAVDGTHYLKGVAIYSDDIPSGSDIRFNTNKTKAEAPKKLDTLKKMSDDPDNPWDAVIKAGGQRGALNIVNEEGDWIQWSKNLSSQMLSKQAPDLAKQQLDLTYEIKKAEYDELKSFTNNTVKKYLLGSFADGADSSSVYLKAKGLPGTQNHVILPFPDMKKNEVYAPQYENGERLVLIRHPHAGRFEIPELIVNNRTPSARRIIGNAIDALGIHPAVAEQLSGADFDGDTVLAIPNRNGKRGVQTDRPLPELEGFDPKVQYRGTENTAKMKNTQTEMGIISNLITDMSVQGAPLSEIARAVKHSMVVIDAQKHGLNYKQSYSDNNIIELKRKYQRSSRGGATTLISQAKSKVKLPDRELRKAQDGGPIDPETGKKVYVETGNTRKNVDGTESPVFIDVRKMENTDDARTLMSGDGKGTAIERVYATHANKLKALANDARKLDLNTTNSEYNKDAARTYSPQVQSLTHQLNTALKNAPLERKAQLLAGAMVKQVRQATPGMEKDQIKKLETRSLATARARTGAGKDRIVLTDKEWEAIQAGAISATRLTAILRNADLKQVKEYATPRTSKGVSPAMLARAKAMYSSGYTQAEIAAALGVSTSTINSALT